MIVPLRVCSILPSRTSAGSGAASDVGWRRRRWRRLALRLTAVVALAGIMALSAQARLPLPFTPIPVTLQTGAVLLPGALLGPWLGLAATALYLATGWLGLPVLTGPPSPPAADRGMRKVSPGLMLYTIPLP